MPKQKKDARQGQLGNVAESLSIGKIIVPLRKETAYDCTCAFCAIFNMLLVGFCANMGPTPSIVSA